MSFQLLSSALDPAKYNLPANLANYAEWSLWLKPTGRSFELQDSQELCSAFAEWGLKPIVWRYWQRNSFMNTRIDDYRHASRLRRIPPENIVLQSTLDIQPDEKIYADAIWLSPDSVGDLANSIGPNSELAFLLPSEKNAAAWAKMVQGRFWVKIAVSFLTSSRNPLIVIDSVQVTYIAATVAQGGAATLPWSDWESKYSLSIFGLPSLLQPIAKQLQNSPSFAGIISDQEAYTIFARGVNRRT